MEINKSQDRSDKSELKEKLKNIFGGLGSDTQFQKVPINTEQYKVDKKEEYKANITPVNKHESIRKSDDRDLKKILNFGILEKILGNTISNNFISNDIPAKTENTSPLNSVDSRFLIKDQLSNITNNNNIARVIPQSILGNSSNKNFKFNLVQVTKNNPIFNLDHSINPSTTKNNTTSISDYDYNSLRQSDVIKNNTSTSNIQNASNTENEITNSASRNTNTSSPRTISESNINNAFDSSRIIGGSYSVSNDSTSIINDVSNSQSTENTKRSTAFLDSPSTFNDSIDTHISNINKNEEEITAKNTTNNRDTIAQQGANNLNINDTDTILNSTNNENLSVVKKSDFNTQKLVQTKNDLQTTESTSSNKNSTNIVNKNMIDNVKSNNTIGINRSFDESIIENNSNITNNSDKSENLKSNKNYNIADNINSFSDSNKNSHNENTSNIKNIINENEPLVVKNNNITTKNLIIDSNTIESNTKNSSKDIKETALVSKILDTNLNSSKLVDKSSIDSLSSSKLIDINNKSTHTTNIPSSNNNLLDKSKIENNIKTNKELELIKNNSLISENKISTQIESDNLNIDENHINNSDANLNSIYTINSSDILNSDTDTNILHNNGTNPGNLIINASTNDDSYIKNEKLNNIKNNQSSSLDINSSANINSSLSNEYSKLQIDGLKSRKNIYNRSNLVQALYGAKNIFKDISYNNHKNIIDVINSSHSSTPKNINNIAPPSNTNLLLEKSSDNTEIKSDHNSINKNTNNFNLTNSSTLSGDTSSLHENALNVKTTNSNINRTNRKLNSENITTRNNINNFDDAESISLESKSMRIDDRILNVYSSELNKIISANKANENDITNTISNDSRTTINDVSGSAFDILIGQREPSLISFTNDVDGQLHKNNTISKTLLNDQTNEIQNNSSDSNTQINSNQNNVQKIRNISNPNSITTRNKNNFKALFLSKMIELYEGSKNSNSSNVNSTNDGDIESNSNYRISNNSKFQSIVSTTPYNIKRFLSNEIAGDSRNISTFDQSNLSSNSKISLSNLRSIVDDRSNSTADVKNTNINSNKNYANESNRANLNQRYKADIINLAKNNISNLTEKSNSTQNFGDINSKAFNASRNSTIRKILNDARKNIKTSANSSNNKSLHLSNQNSRSIANSLNKIYSKSKINPVDIQKIPNTNYSFIKNISSEYMHDVIGDKSNSNNKNIIEQKYSQTSMPFSVALPNYSRINGNNFINKSKIINAIDGNKYASNAYSSNIAFSKAEINPTYLSTKSSSEHTSEGSSEANNIDFNHTFIPSESVIREIQEKFYSKTVNRLGKTATSPTFKLIGNSNTIESVNDNRSMNSSISNTINNKKSNRKNMVSSKAYMANGTGALPALRAGGFVKTPTVAYLHQNEAVVPLDKSKEFSKFISDVSSNTSSVEKNVSNSDAISMGTEVNTDTSTRDILQKITKLIEVNSKQISEVMQKQSAPSAPVMMPQQTREPTPAQQGTNNLGNAYAGSGSMSDFFTRSYKIPDWRVRLG